MTLIWYLLTFLFGALGILGLLRCLESFPNEGSGLLFVFDYQDAHGNKPNRFEHWTAIFGLETHGRKCCDVAPIFNLLTMTKLSFAVHWAFILALFNHVIGLCGHAISNSLNSMR